MAALAFIRLLEDRGLLDPEIVVEITRQVETSKVRITPEAIARLLVDNGQLTRFQATKLISELNETVDRPRNDATTALRGGRPIDEESDKDSVEDLLPAGWKPVDPSPQRSMPKDGSSLPPAKPALGDKASIDEDEIIDVEIFEDADDKSDHPTGTASERFSHGAKRSPEIVDAEIVDEELVEDDHLEELTEVKEISSKPTPSIPNKPHVAPKVPKAKSGTPRKNAWDSFRILGIGSILGILLLVLVPLLFWFTQGSADDAYQSAKNAYETRNYSQASKAFGDFASSYPRNANASSARVLSVLANVRENAERVSDPMVALRVAQEQLPTILSEDGMAALRPDMTDAMLRIADKFSEKIDSTADLDSRQTLLTSLNSLVDMLNDTRFLGAQERAQNALRLRNLEESVSRANRGIQRDLDRLAAVAKMQQAIEAQDVAQTYAIRRELLRRYPVLEGDSEISELLNQATSIQQGLIVDAKELPALSTEDSASNNAHRAFLFYRESFSTGRDAAAAQGDEESTIFVNSKGTLVALASIDGAIRWQKLISPDWTSPPQYDPSIAGSEITVTLHEQGIVRRYSSSDGSLLWEAVFSGPILEPKIDAEDIFVACVSGAVHCLDAASGTSKWGKQFPQEISSPVAGASNKRQRYVIASNSNLYAISRAGGTCEEVEYLGHQPNTIKVAPLWILNHLLVFENAGPDYATLRIFETDSEGLNIRPSAQLPIRFRGHFVVSPEVDGRRFSVATNLGEFAVFEVDPSNKTEKVHRVASFAEQEHAPRITWPKMVGSDLYLTSNRIALYEIQVSSQKLNRVWQREDGDEFLGRPISTPNGIVHTRLVRGNLGTRVTLVDPKKGDMRWETDIASPVTVVANEVDGGNSAGQDWTAITALGSLFRFSTADIDQDATISQTESLGRNQRMVKFTRSVKLRNGRIVLFNESKSDQLLLVDPKRKTTASKLFSINLGGGRVTQAPVLAGKHIVLPLSNSQIALVNSDQMQPAGTPFQPTLSAGEQSDWLNPVAIQNGQTLIVADRERMLYKLSVGNQLVNSLEVELENPLTGRLTNIANTVFAVSSLDTSDQIEMIDALELKTQKSIPLDGRLVWGPFSTVKDSGESTESNENAVVLVQSDLEGLIAISKLGEKVWQSPLEQIELAGSPTLHAGGCLLMTVQGEILNFELSSGKIIGRADIGASPSSEPIVVGEQIYVPTISGAVVKLQIPNE